MKLPRDISGRELADLLHLLGYEISHQRGSHIRLTTERDGKHNLTIPDHRTLRIGTLNGIIRDLSEHHGLEREALLETLFS